MFGDQCCTFIPNNTAPDGSVTRALSGLKALSAELHVQNRGNDEWMSWLESQFGKWKGVFMSVIITILVLGVILALCGCCCILCLGSLIERCIATAMSREATEIKQMLLQEAQQYQSLSTTDPDDCTDLSPVPEHDYDNAEGVTEEDYLDNPQDYQDADV